jgi:FkbM family methyltransferase
VKLTHILYKIVIKIWEYNPFKKETALFFKTTNIPLKKIKNDLWFNGSFSVNYFNTKFKLISQKDDKSTLSIFWDNLDKGWDAKSIEIWGKLAKSSDIIFDIGSNIGLYAIAAKTINGNSIVYAFEPSRKMINILNKNIEVNRLAINVAQIALTNFNGQLDFYDLDSPTAVASLKLNQNLKSNENLISYKVNTSTLLSFVEEKNIQKIDLISIDVEMNEPEVLEGMGHLIEKFRPNFIIEVLNNEMGQRIESFFNDLDYLYFSIDEINGLTKQNKIARLNDLNVNHSFNFLVCSHKSAIHLNLL